MAGIIKRASLGGKHIKREQVQRKAYTKRASFECRLINESKLRRQAYSVKESKLRRQAYKRDQA
jgi:hypothetical protein